MWYNVKYIRMLRDDIVSPALEYYDRAQEKHKTLFGRLIPINFKIDQSIHDLEHNKITFYDKKNVEIVTSNYEIVGVYSNFHKMWCWAWSVPTLNKNET